MNKINTTEAVHIEREDGIVFDLPKGSVYVNFDGDTVNFILTALPHNKGISLLSTRANNLEVNGTVYSIEDLRDGHALDGLYPIEGIVFQMVEELPTEGSTSVIYLLPVTTPQEKDSYDEYIWFNNAWEKIGNTTNIDLDNYYTKTETDAFLLKKMERVELYFESVASGIKDKDGNVLSFEEVKALVEDTSKFVTLMYQGFNWLLPTIDDNGDAIQFEGTYIISGDATIERVMINLDDELSAYSIPVENANRKKQDISTVAEADKQKYYPSVKAVENYVDAKIGNINNVLETLIG